MTDWPRLNTTLTTAELDAQFPIVDGFHSEVRIGFLTADERAALVATSSRRFGIRRVPFRMLCPLRVRIGGVDGLIEEGFVSDASTVFIWIRWLIGSPLDWKNLVPGIWHDRLVTPAGGGIGGKLLVSRERAARLFLAALNAKRKRRYTRALMYVVVRADAVGRRIASYFTGTL